MQLATAKKNIFVNSQKHLVPVFNITNITVEHFVGNEAKGRVRMTGYEMLVFQKICCALFSCIARFVIRPFALLPTVLVIYSNSVCMFLSISLFCYVGFQANLYSKFSMNL